MEIPIEIIAAILSSGALSAVISGIFALVQSHEKKKDGVAAGVQQILYFDLKTACKEHIERGYVATNDLDDLERMHKIYHDYLNGNGFMDDLMAKVRQLPVRPVLPEDK